MTRVILHTGFHKTGTTSLQDFMSRNRRILKPDCQYFGKMDFLAAGAHARIYAQRPFRWRLWRFRRSLRRFLATVEPSPQIVLSRETFSGGMPGHKSIGGRRIQNYQRSARALLPVIASEIIRRFGPDTQITFFLTTREKEAWIKSIHGHLLRSIKLPEDYDTFRAGFTDLLSPAEEAARLAQILPYPVVTAALEDSFSLAEGPAAPLLDLLKIPPRKRARMKPAPKSNIGPKADLRDTYLQLNRSNLRGPRLKTAKEAALKEHQNGK
jgi:hypothetical protein